MSDNKQYKWTNNESPRRILRQHDHHVGADLGRRLHGSRLVQAMSQKMLNGIETAGKRILDIGCGLGGPAFEMANTFGADVVGIDLEVKCH